MAFTHLPSNYEVNAFNSEVITKSAWEMLIGVVDKSSISKNINHAEGLGLEINE